LTNRLIYILRSQIVVVFVRSTMFSCSWLSQSHQFNEKLAALEEGPRVFRANW